MKGTALSDVLARSMDDSRRRSREEYGVLYAAFLRLLDEWDNGAGGREAIEDIITLRASFLIDRAIEGMGIDFDRALELLRNHNGFTTAADRQKRDILVAAIDNLVEFAAAEECAMMDEIPPELDRAIEEEGGYEALFARYNGAGAAQENEDVLYSAAMAAWWIGIDEQTLLTYMTMGDERVRPWHEAYEGYSYPKSQFPPELIPPIEWGCRCFLVAEGMASVVGSLAGAKSPVTVNPVFSESLATGGRIFSPEHPYFKKPLPPRVRRIVEEIKAKFHTA
jgi:hypothetical protein